ncbi:MAG: MBL fold metallo-hydrolase [Bacteroidales bacterium]|nr:MBL fold metallo-hydrolase [Bacteroidales bacterium]
MKLTRVIHPVGQGGFYTETFVDDNGKEVFNAIYDCGSETQKPTLIKKYLKDWINRNPQRIINAVFISHLHEDHINGLDELLSTGRVNCLFLPQLTSKVIIEAYLYNYYKTGSLDNEGNLFISKALRNEYQVRFVQINEMDGDNNNNPGDPIHINEAIRNSYPSGSVFYNNFVDYHGNMFRWLYIPFNSPLQSKKGEIKNDTFFSSVKNPDGQVNPQKLMELIVTEGIEKCKSIYAEYFGKTRHNTYSMTLFSGIENHNSIIVDYYARYTRYKCCCCDRKYCPPKRGCSPNFLYTGDFEPNRNNLRKSYVELTKECLDRLNLWDTIRRIQVPHHGSRNNFNSTLYEYARTGYISAGSKNVHGHPNADTLVNIQNDGCVPVVVNEDPKSIQKEVYLF